MEFSRTNCIEFGCVPGMWMRVDFNQQERRCINCNRIVVTANIPKPADDTSGREGGRPS